MKRKDMKDNDWSKFPNFRKEEFKCGCVKHGLNYCNGYPSEIAYSLVEIMQKIRNHYGKPITISSGVRCKKYNNKLKGSSGVSNHLEGLACDFRFSGMNKNEVIKYLKTLPNYRYSYTNSTNMANGIHITVYPTYESQPQTKYAIVNGNVWCRKDGYGFKYSKWLIIPQGTKVEIVKKDIGTANCYKWDKIIYKKEVCYLPNKWNIYE